MFQKKKALLWINENKKYLRAIYAPSISSHISVVKNEIWVVFKKFVYYQSILKLITIRSNKSSEA